MTGDNDNNTPFLKVNFESPLIIEDLSGFLKNLSGSVKGIEGIVTNSTSMETFTRGTATKAISNLSGWVLYKDEKGETSVPLTLDFREDRVYGVILKVQDGYTDSQKAEIAELRNVIEVYSKSYQQILASTSET